MTRRPCIDCGEATDGSRCPACAAARTATADRRRGTPTQRGYNARWARLSRRARRAQPFCLWCGSPDRLQADHLRWPARTLDDVRVLCAPCHTRAPARRGINPRGETPPEPPETPPPEAQFPLLQPHRTELR